MSIVTEIQNAIDRCSIGCDTTTQAGRLQVVNNCLDLFESWRNQDARDYLAALGTGVDLSPNEFHATRKQAISIG